MKQSWIIFPAEEFCATQSPKISNFRKHGVQIIQDETSMQFYFSTEGLVRNNWKSKQTNPNTTKPKRKSQKPITQQSYSLCSYTFWFEAGFCLQTHSPVQPEFVQPKKPQHKVLTGTERVAGTYKTWVTATNAKLWLLLRRFRNQMLMRLTPLRFWEKPPWSEQLVGSPLVQWSSFSTYTAFKYLNTFLLVLFFF